MLDWLYPPRCEACETPLQTGRAGIHQWMCDGCYQSLIRITPPYCEICGEAYDGAITTSFRCGNCSEVNLQFEFAIAAYEASGKLRDLIHRFKYQKQLHLRGLLGSLLMEVFTEPRLQNITPDQWLLIPVPLHAIRRWSREFNQSWELCKEVSKQTGIPATHALRRVRATKSQARLSRQQRLKNLHHSFTIKNSRRIKSKLTGANVLLVDDVLTTGSTASECAKLLLKQGGAEKVVVISVGRG